MILRINFSGIDDDRVRAVKMHELVNLLPDANYSTLRALMKHLWKYGICCFFFIFSFRVHQCERKIR